MAQMETGMKYWLVEGLGLRVYGLGLEFRVLVARAIPVGAWLRRLGFNVAVQG